MHDETTRLSMDATERALAGAHEARRAAVVGGTPQLVAWVDALARAELEWLAHEASADQAEGSDSERDPCWFGALASVRACLDASRTVGPEARVLLPLSPSTTFIARGLEARPTNSP
jgi:hypothetical protein